VFNLLHTYLSEARTQYLLERLNSCAAAEAEAAGCRAAASGRLGWVDWSSVGRYYNN